MRGTISSRPIAGPGSTGRCARLLALVLPRPALFRARADRRRGARAGRFARLLPRTAARDAGAGPGAACRAASPIGSAAGHSGASGTRRSRVALLAGCAQQVLAPQINEATIRLLTRHGCEVVVAEGAGCCGALTHHLGQRPAHGLRARQHRWPGAARSRRAGSTPSSSTPRAAARRSRITASCCATTRRSRTRRANDLRAGARHHAN